MATRWDRITIYADRTKLERQASRWARGVYDKTGATVTQPVSAYCRYLLDKDAKKGAKR